MRCGHLHVTWSFKTECYERSQTWKLPAYESIYVNCLTKSTEIHRLMISKELSVILEFLSRVIKNASELYTADGCATMWTHWKLLSTAFVLSFIYLFIPYYLLYCMCGVQVHGYRGQKKLLLVLYCSPHISLRTEYVLTPETHVFWFSQLGWKSTCPSNPPASVLLRAGITNMPGGQTCYVAARMWTPVLVSSCMFLTAEPSP